MGFTKVAASGITTDQTFVFTNINASGVITATSFSGDGSGLENVEVVGVNTSGSSTFNNINASGVITATSFVGSGANLTGVSGFASALENSGPLNNIFKTSKTLEVTAGIHTVNSDAASDNVAFMRESIIHVAAGATFHIGSGTTLRTNILNLF